MPSRIFRSLFLFAFIATALPAYAQQTGVIGGKVADRGGGVLPGVTVEARADVLPGAARHDDRRQWRVPACRRCRRGTTRSTFVLAGMQNVTRQAEVQLCRTRSSMRRSGSRVSPRASRSPPRASLIEKDTATIKSGLSSTQITPLPVGQEYRDLLKLIPGVQYSQDSVRGPSAGGSGQDNVYQFDGVNVTLPLFGTLSAEPSSHDIAQVDDRPRRRARGRLRSLGRLLDRHDQQVGHEPILRARSATSSRTPA